MYSFKVDRFDVLVNELLHIFHVIVKVFSEIGLALIIDLKYDCLLQCLLNLDGSLQSQRAGANRVNPHLKM